MTDILNKILATKAQEVVAQKASVSLDEMKKQADAALPVRGFLTLSVPNTSKTALPSLLKLKKPARAKD